MGIRAYWKSGKLNFWDSQINTTFKTGVWADCPLLAMQCDPTVAYEFFEDWVNFKGTASATTLTGWTLTQASTGAVSISDTQAGGILLLDSNSITEAQGAQIQYTTGTLPFIPAATKDIWFECKLKIVDTYDKCELFAGLSAVDTSIIAGSDMTAANHIGFECHTDDGVILFGGEKAGAEATPVTSNTIADDTYVRLGFKVNGVTSVSHYVDGVLIGTSILTANIPIVGITPSFVCQSGGTNDPIMHLDWVRIVQLR